jgi:hypothetical protein
LDTPGSGRKNGVAISTTHHNWKKIRTSQTFKRLLIVFQLLDYPGPVGLNCLDPSVFRGHFMIYHQQSHMHPEQELNS